MTIIRSIRANVYILILWKELKKMHILCYNIKKKILKSLVKLATTFENCML